MDVNKHNLTDYRCKRCKFVQARTDGVDLYFDARPVPLKPIAVAWICINCKAEVRWRKEVKNGNDHKG